MGISNNVLSKSCGVCSDFKQWKTTNQSTASPSKKDEASQPSAKDEPSHYKNKTPVDYKELGNSTWNFLHTLSVYYSDNPSENEKSAAKNLMHSISLLYPCKTCASDLELDLKIHSVKAENRVEFSKYMCDLHNRINSKLGKPQFDCSEIFKRWLGEDNKF